VIYIEDDGSESDFLAPEVEEHIKVFGVEPVVIGLFWKEPGAVKTGILEAIKTGKPYNERLMLSVEERAAFDAGEIMF
jgi:hypothetical protein